MLWWQLSYSFQQINYRRRQEAEKSESYETWLAKKESEKQTTSQQLQPVEISRPHDLDISDKTVPPAGPRQDGYLRSYLRSLDERKRTNTYFCFEDWLNKKEETVLGIHRQKTTSAS